MIYLGIDIAKNFHVAAAITSEGEIILTPFSFANSAAGFALLKERMDSLPKMPLLIGLESTTHYGENLIYFLCGNGYHVAMINHLQTSAMRKSAIRKTKTDKVDAFVIAKSLMMEGYTELKPTDINLLKLKGLCKTRQNLILMRTRCKIQLGSFVDQLFPELNQFFRAGLPYQCLLYTSESSFQTRRGAITSPYLPFKPFAKSIQRQVYERRCHSLA